MSLPRSAATPSLLIRYPRHHFGCCDPASVCCVGHLFVGHSSVGDKDAAIKAAVSILLIWDTVNVFPPNVSDLVLLCLCYRCPHSSTYMMPSSSSANPIISYRFFIPVNLPLYHTIAAAVSINPRHF